MCVYIYIFEFLVGGLLYHSRKGGRSSTESTHAALKTHQASDLLSTTEKKESTGSSKVVKSLVQFTKTRLQENPNYFQRNNLILFQL